MYKNLFWHISRKIGKILENFQKVPFEALLKQQKIFSKSLMKMDRFPKKIFFIEKSNCHNFWRFLSYAFPIPSMMVSPDEKKPIYICRDNIWLRKVECGILHAVTWSSRTQQWCCWSILEPYTARLWAWVKKMSERQTKAGNQELFLMFSNVN